VNYARWSGVILDPNGKTAVTYEGYSKINLQLAGKNKPVAQRHGAFPVATSKV
jgi:hypothetical protein